MMATSCAWQADGHNKGKPMSERILTPIIDMVEQSPDVNNREVFNQLWSILGEMNDKIQARFELNLDPCSERFRDYKRISVAEEGAEGSLHTYSGPEVDWYVHSYIGSPESTFTNMHITLSLGPQYLVPNFGFALGTVPDLFMYMDYIPRVDLIANIDYVDRYYSEVNEEFLDLQSDDRFNPFISRDLYTRVAMTPTAVGYTAKAETDLIARPSLPGTSRSAAISASATRPTTWVTSCSARKRPMPWWPHSGAGPGPCLDPLAPDFPF
jgi:hypothetical protein